MNGIGRCEKIICIVITYDMWCMP